MQVALTITVGAIEIQAFQGLEGSLNQTNGAGVAFWQAVVALVAALPDAVVPHPVGASHVIDEVLQEVPFVAGLHHHQSRTGQLGELQQEQGRGIEL